MLFLFLEIVSEVVAGTEIEIGGGAEVVTGMTDINDIDPDHPNHGIKIKMRSNLSYILWRGRSTLPW